MEECTLAANELLHAYMLPHSSLHVQTDLHIPILQTKPGLPAQISLKFQQIWANAFCWSKYHVVSVINGKKQQPSATKWAYQIRQHWVLDEDEDFSEYGTTWW